MSTTHINEPTEPNAKSKDGQLLETISLRDYFAATALQGLLSNANTCNAMLLATDAYKIANAMLKVRATGETK